MPQSTFSLGPDDSISIRGSVHYPHVPQNYGKTNYAASSVYSRNTLGETVVPLVQNIASSYRRKPLPHTSKRNDSSRAPSKVTMSGLTQKMLRLQTTSEQVESVDEKNEDHVSIVSFDGTHVTELPTHNTPAIRSKSLVDRPTSSASADAVTSVSYASSGKTEWPAYQPTSWATKQDAPATGSQHGTRSRCQAIDNNELSNRNSSSSTRERSTTTRDRLTSHTHKAHREEEPSNRALSARSSKKHHQDSDEEIARLHHRPSSSKRERDNAGPSLSRSHTHTGTGSHSYHNHSTSSRSHKNASKPGHDAIFRRSKSMPPISNVRRTHRSKRKRSRVQRFARWLTKYLAGGPAGAEIRRRPTH